MSEPSMLAALREVFAHVSPKRRRQLIPLLALMLLGAIAELISIGAILPFLALIADPAAASTGPLRSLTAAVGLTTPFQIVLAAALVFALAAVVAGAIRLLLVWVSQRFVFGVAHELSTAVYRRVLDQPYAWHAAHNSSETLAAINKAQIVTNGLLVPLMQAASAAVIAIFIMVGLIVIDTGVAIVSALGFAGIYLLVMRVTRKVMRNNGGIIARAQKERVQAASEGLGGIRDILLDHTQQVFSDRFNAVEARLRRAQATNNFIAAAPRFIVEGLGVVLIAGLALILSLREGGLLGAIPVLGAMALGAQRMVPLLQQIYQGWSASLNMGQSMQDVLELLRLPGASQLGSGRFIAPLTFDQNIELRDIGFAYPGANGPTLSRINILIPKGARVGIIGKTGSGKSTLVDLIMGLLPPCQGAIFVDGTELNDKNRSAWQARIAHVPQVIYLADATIAENIAFGVPLGEIDGPQVLRAAEQAELTEFIAALPSQYDTVVGERGVRLSGGQRQRIGIARALYRKADVLTFDEATSALDSETEAAVMSAINSLSGDLTVVIIAHRESTLSRSDMIFRMEDGRVQTLTVSSRQLMQEKALKQHHAT